MMLVSFLKQVSLEKTDNTTIRVGVPKYGTSVVPMPYLESNGLYNLLSFNLLPLEEVWFANLYDDFTTNSKNAEFLVEDQLDFGYHFKPSKVLNESGLVRFAQENNRRFQFSLQDVENFMAACLVEFESARRLEHREKVLRKRKLPTNQEMLPINALYNSLVSGEIRGFEESEIFELKLVLNSRNTFYIMELKNNQYLVGQSRLRFGTMLLEHDTYLSESFVKFYGVYLFDGPGPVDCATLEEGFLLKAAKILQVETFCGKEGGCILTASNVNEIRHILELSLLTPKHKYNARMAPVTHERVLNLLCSKGRETVLQSAGKSGEE